jgi:thiosulfate dehydrogenase
LADPVRGGLLYDKWWVVNDAPVPTGKHPLYPPGGLQTGSATFRCKECHGWDYKGVDGAYGSGSHFTGIKGVWGTTRSPKELFDLLKADPAEVPNGHNMDAYGMSDRDLWDVVRMTLEGVVDTDLYIDASTPEVFLSPYELFVGNFWYDMLCMSCHDDPQGGQDKGTWYNFGTPQNPEYIGTLANDNPWEFLHKMRFGHPGTSMISMELLGWSLEEAAAIGAFSVTLPTQ